MKKILIIFLLPALLLVSCKQKNNTEKDSIKIAIDETSILENYYIDEFDVSTITLLVTKNDVTTSINLTTDMIENFDKKIGKNTYKVVYEKETTTFTVNLMERESYTKGLIFVLTNNEYAISSYTGTEEKVIIPSTYNFKKVTSIKNNAFNGNKIVKEVVLPESIETIGNQAFFNCENLKKINLPDSITSIGEATFYNALKLKSVYLSKNIKNIGKNAFSSTRIIYMENQTIPSTWNSSFCDFKEVCLYLNLKREELKENNNFEYVITNEEVTILNYINSSNDVEIPSTIDNLKVTKIGEYAFDNSEITSLKLNENLQEIGDYAFRSNLIITLTMPNTLKIIGKYAFSYCFNLEVLNLNEGLEKIDNAAFSSDENIKKIILPKTLTTLSDYAFQNCYYIEEVYIPSNVTYVGEYTFYAMHGTIYLEKDSVPSTWAANWNPSGAKVVFNHPYNF